jgi:hypothetical protein
LACSPTTKRKPAKAKSKTPKRERRDFSQIALGVVQQATGEKSDWLSEPASPKSTGRKIKHKKTGKEYVIGDVFGERHVEMDT